MAAAHQPLSRRPPARIPMKRSQVSHTPAFVDDDDDDDDELPLARRMVPKKQRLSKSSTEDSDEEPLSRLKRTGNKRARPAPASSPPSESRLKQVKKSRKSSTTSPARSKANTSSAKAVKKEPKKVKSKTKEKAEPQLASAGNPDDRKDPGQAGYRWWDEQEGDEAKVKWSTLTHHGVVFPPEYEPHGKKMFYKRQPVDLTIKSEEIATFYAAKLATDYVKKPTFQKNFFEDFRDSLKGSSAYKIVRKLEFCDFSRIYEHLEKVKAEKKELPAAERKRIKEAEQQRFKKYTVALVDGREEKVGNFRVEPPGLFLGRGEHPKMGRVKGRIYPEDITINIGETEPVPECPVPGHKWGSIVHKKDVTWLCGWKDTITGGSKYVWLSAGSVFKGMSDHAKFEKARKLSLCIDSIRADYRNDFKAKSKEVRQRAVAMYLIDKLALRVGNEKGEDEADTVGCCSLRVEHIKFEAPRTVVFDFLGKDSIRYFNKVEVEKYVFDALKLFCRNKQPDEEIFHRLTVTGLNEYLKSRMDGLSAKVFRTFNASQTLDDLLQEMPADADDNEKIVFYNQQNKEVAILCNHQRALPKAHGTQMEKMDKKITDCAEWLEELERGRDALKRKRDQNATIELTQMMPEKPQFTEDMNDKERAAERKRALEAPRVPTKRKKNLAQCNAGINSVTARMGKLKADMQVKDDLKTVALGTSKINYLDPRITVAWCKKHEVPIEKIFAKTLLVKFAWAMEVSEDFRFVLNP